jgi:hypothetical protein
MTFSLLLIGSVISTLMVIYFIIIDIKFCFDLKVLNYKINTALYWLIVKSFIVNLIWLGVSILCLILNL